MLDIARVAPPHDAQEHVLDQIIRLVGIVYMPLEEAGQRATQQPRPVGKR